MNEDNNSIALKLRAQQVKYHLHDFYIISYKFDKGV